MAPVPRSCTPEEPRAQAKGEGGGLPDKARPGRVGPVLGTILWLCWSPVSMYICHYVYVYIYVYTHEDHIYNLRIRTCYIEYMEMYLYMYAYMCVYISFSVHMKILIYIHIHTYIHE